MREDWARQAELSALPILQLLVVSGFAGKYPAVEPRVAISSVATSTAKSESFAAAGAYATAAPAANYAFDAARCNAFVSQVGVDYDVGRAVANAVRTAELASSGALFASAAMLNASSTFAGPQFWSEVHKDSWIVDEERDLMAARLWSSSLPDWFVEYDRRGRAIWAADPPGRWDFWIRWWDGILAGKPLDWDLQRDVALIPDADWQQGPDHIARLIARIELDHAIAATPNAEGIERDADGLFFAVPVVSGPPNPFRNSKDKVADTVAEIRAKLSHNAISAILDDLTRLEDHLRRYADNPLRIHDVFEKTIRHIRSKLATTELSQEDLVDDLLHDLDSGAIDIRRSDKEVARTVKARGSERLKRLKAVERSRYDSAMVDASAEARDDLKAEIKDDLAIVTAPLGNDAMEADRDEASYRLISRGARMAKRRKDDLVKLADDVGKLDKGAQAVGKVADAAPGWWDYIASLVGGFFS